jgi:superfamily II DNA/RNA helicase
LAIQVAKFFETYGSRVKGFGVATIYGGQGYDPQFRQLKQRPQVVVGTPGRVIDHLERKTIDLSELQWLVLDEADEMLNMGFLDDVKKVLEHTPDERRIALFSATMPGPIREIADQYLADPARITIKQKTMTAENIRQRAVVVKPHYKLEVLTRLLEIEETDGVIVFTKTREASVEVAERLVKAGLTEWRHAAANARANPGAIQERQARYSRGHRRRGSWPRRESRQPRRELRFAPRQLFLCPSRWPDRPSGTQGRSLHLARAFTARKAEVDREGNAAND